MPDRPNLPAGRGRAVDLVPLAMTPLESLYEIALVGGAGATWRTRGRTVSFERFAEFLWEAGDCAFGVIDRQSQQVAGFVGLYGHDLVSSVASLSAFFDPRQSRAALIAGDAIEAFCRYAFATVGLRKITVEMPAPLSDGLAGACARLPFVTHEGTLRAHAKMGTELLDMDIYAVWGDRFLDWQQTRSGAGGDAAIGTLDRVRDLLEGLAAAELPAQLTGGHRLVDDLGLDSLALIELLVALEADLDEPFPAQALDQGLTVQDLVALVEHLQHRQADPLDLPRAGIWPA